MKALTIVISSIGIVLYLCLCGKYLYDHPICPKCKDGLPCERDKSGKIICQIHGDVTGCDLIKETEEE